MVNVTAVVMVFVLVWIVLFLLVCISTDFLSSILYICMFFVSILFFLPVLGLVNGQIKTIISILIVLFVLLTGINVTRDIIA
jgi:hypothetical protein